MTKEALKLALEALTYSGLKPEGTCDVDKAAITAIKEALAQPAQEPDELTIAYMSGLYDGKKKRPWIGLTQEEENEIWKSSRGVQETITKTQAKLKEKNFD